MKKQGILFQGLYFSTKAEQYIDATYFLLYALCKNPMTGKMLKTMEKNWKDYILFQAEKSTYQKGEFWEYLNNEETESAEILLGFLEEIRNCHTVRWEKARIAFEYVFCKIIGKEYDFLSKENRISFEKICSVAGKYREVPFLTSSYICAAFFWAECLNIKIQKNGTYDLLYPCLKEEMKIWENGRRAVN